MTGNVKLPGVSKEEFRRMLMFANSKRSGTVMGDRSSPFGKSFQRCSSMRAGRKRRALLQKETIEVITGMSLPGLCRLPYR